MTKVLSFGGGVQTTALLRMCLAGDFERPDHVIFADTQDEPRAVYEAVAREEALCEAAGIAFHIVTAGRLSDALKNGQVFIPAFTSDGGQLLRQCTHRFKMIPIRRFMRSIGLTEVEIWIGMSTDEIQRVKPSGLLWITNRHPLVELDMRRSDCEALLLRAGLPIVKSACTFCPLHGRASWDIVRRDPDDWDAAVAYDHALRDARPGLKTYVHPARVPLPEAVADAAPTLFDDECEGVCFT